MTLELKNSKNNKLIEVYINDNEIGYALLGNRPKNQVLRSLHYLVNQVDPSISRDLVEYELDLMLKPEF